MIFVRKFQVSRSKLLRIESKHEPRDSSKGGDGKSTVTTQIAWTLYTKGKKVS